MTFDEFYKTVTESYDEGGEQRFGQWCFNKLHEHKPQLANRIAGSQFSDPFNDDTNLRTFWFIVRTQGEWDDPY